MAELYINRQFCSGSKDLYGEKEFKRRQEQFKRDNEESSQLKINEENSKQRQENFRSYS